MDEVDDWMKWMIGWNGWTDERRNLLPRVRNGSISYSEINSDLPIRHFHSYIQKLNRRQLYYWINVAKRNNLTQRRRSSLARDTYIESKENTFQVIQSRIPTFLPRHHNVRTAFLTRRKESEQVAAPTFIPCGKWPQGRK